MITPGLLADLRGSELAASISAFEPRAVGGDRRGGPTPALI